MGSSVTASILVAALVIGMIGDRMDARRFAAASAETVRIQQQVEASLVNTAKVKIEFPVQADLVSGASTALQQAQASLVQAKGMAASAADAGDLHEPMAALNRKAAQYLSSATSSIALARQVPSYARQIEQVKQFAEKSTGWPQLDEVLAHRLMAASAMLSSPQAVSGLPAAVEDLNTLAVADRTRTTLQEAAKTVPPDGSEQALALVVAGETALLRGQAGGANAALDQLRDLTQLGAASYTLRITNDPNEQTGVWRHHSSSPGARNHYIVVDAVDAAGAQVQVQVVNEEDGSRHKVSRFAVRVPESVYNRVRDDKLDNGLVDDNNFGTKKSGTLETKYAFDVEGGMITSW